MREDPYFVKRCSPVSQGGGEAFARRAGMSATSLERQYLGMSETPALQVKRAKGDFVYDSRGKKYIDFVMGCA